MKYLLSLALLLCSSHAAFASGDGALSDVLLLWADQVQQETMVVCMLRDPSNAVATSKAWDRWSATNAEAVRELQQRRDTLTSQLRELAFDSRQKADMHERLAYLSAMDVGRVLANAFLFQTLANGNDEAVGGLCAMHRTKWLAAEPDPAVQKGIEKLKASGIEWLKQTR
jgi:hypothetical protein